MAGNSRAIKTSGQVKIYLDKAAKPIIVQYGGGSLSAHGGLVLVAQVDKAFKFLEQAGSLIEEWRTDILILHNKLDLLKQRVYQIAVGLEDTNDADIILKDPVFQAVLGKDTSSEETAASQETLSRFENNVSEATLEALSAFFVDFYIACRASGSRYRGSREIVISLDGSAQEAYGCQEGAIYRGGKYKKEMFFPLYIVTDDGWLLGASLRKGDAAESAALPLLKPIVEKLRARWPHVRILLVGDAAFCGPAWYDWAEDNKVIYELGLKSNSALDIDFKEPYAESEQKFKKIHGEPKYLGKAKDKAAHKEHVRIRNLAKDERMAAEKVERHRRVRVFAESEYQARGWRKERRIIARVDYSDKGKDVRLVITNKTTKLPEQIYEEYGHHRGMTEQYIDGLKNHCRLKLSCQSFMANKFRCILHGLAYQLMLLLKQQLPAKIADMNLKSIRDRIINVAVKVIPKAKHILFLLTDTIQNKHAYLSLFQKLNNLRPLSSA